MRRLADCGVVHVEITADSAHDDFSGVQPDTDLDHGRVRASHLVRVLLHALLHPERRVARPHGMILKGEGRPEERHDPVTQDLVDRPLILVNRLHHPFKHGIEDLARLFGIAVGQKFHRALEVGEEDRDVFALAFEGGLGGEDSLGEVSGRVGLRSGEARLSRRVERCCTVAAELVLRRAAGSARRADRGKRYSALAAEPHTSGILRLASGTLHAGTSQPGDGPKGALRLSARGSSGQGPGCRDLARACETPPSLRSCGCRRSSVEFRGERRAVGARRLRIRRPLLAAIPIEARHTRINARAPAPRRGAAAIAPPPRAICRSCCTPSAW